MEPDDGQGDDDPVRPLLPPDDRLWRHPSELASAPLSAARRLVRNDPDERPWLIAMLSGVIGALLATALAAVSGLSSRTVTIHSIEREVAATPVAASSPGGGPDIVAIAERVRPAIVQVVVKESTGEGSGSGVAFRSDGLILTNNHVVAGARNIRIVTADGRELAAKLVGADPETDVAVVQVDERDVPTVVLGTAAGLKVGQPAIAIGSPLGLEGGPSLSVGVISAIGRQVSGHDGPPLLDMIQTDAPIAPGSSGGALLDQTGAVIGITTAIAVSEVGAEGLGFATPIDIARSVADQLVATGTVRHVWLGIRGDDLDRDTASKLGLDGGALVKSVKPDSPADDAGINTRDVITSLDGHRVASMAALVVALRTRRPGDVVTLDLVRGGKRLSRTATLSERPANP